eukprot:CAMPEP_0181212708 /NCGR_PEP_ID=MMETSP1096-20121128/24499_1 /TAXON_ID=156174 ORGANISM="Chrysochromulina ericina, Strain CCMP281" /NCGR_SAMPLE_ID=MMETSP1096 /ASSEMBLY_ACC=CAM_ASM_000453 /LENGTH=66 /DNA_ID=CAMNT_0023304265 /DNA_START=285 /DNA_END=482 /DNA_ORIENTATION=+
MPIQMKSEVRMCMLHLKHVAPPLQLANREAAVCSGTLPLGGSARLCSEWALAQGPIQTSASNDPFT